jgi:hypothetical protein
LIGIPLLTRVFRFPVFQTSSPLSFQIRRIPTMTLNPPAAYGIYSYDAELSQVVHTLKQSGFDKANICMMVSPAHPIATFVREANILNAERREDAVAEEFMGWLFEFGAVVIPTVGFFIRSQVFLRALMANGNSECLAGLGFSERDAARFENQLREMGVLVYVACPKNANAAWAVEILRRTGAKEPGLLEQEAFPEAAAWQSRMPSIRPALHIS